MREVLIALALVSNARTAVWDGGGSGCTHGDVGERDYALVDDRGRGRLAPDDAPDLRYRGLWLAAVTDLQRAGVLRLARAELKAITRSRGDRTREESKADRDRRIVAEGAGLPAGDVAVWARCGVRDVHRAREAAGRDAQFGWPLQDVRELAPVERVAEVERLHGSGLSARQIERATGLSYSTVLRDLGRKDAARLAS